MERARERERKGEGESVSVCVEHSLQTNTKYTRVIRYQTVCSLASIAATRIRRPPPASFLPKPLYSACPIFDGKVCL